MVACTADVSVNFCVWYDDGVFTLSPIFHIFAPPSTQYSYNSLSCTLEDIIFFVSHDLCGPMPALGSGYAFADFLRRLERSPVSQMSPLYHAHCDLFRERPDMFTKTVMGISWERSLALLDAAYYAQPIEVETYRGVLARMLLHNHHVRGTGSGSLVDWRAATKVYAEAVRTHGNAVPTRMTVSILRLIAPHRQTTEAIGILKLAQANGKLTKPMVMEAAHACASPDSWSDALRLLMHVHKDDPLLIAGAIQSLRPPGTDELARQEGVHSLLTDTVPQPSAEQRHILHILTDVVSNVPWRVAMRSELCHSFLTHLAACTVLSQEEKTKALATAVANLPLEAVVKLLGAYTEPNFLDDKEWADALALLPAPEVPRRKTSCKKKSAKRKVREKVAAGLSVATPPTATGSSDNPEGNTLPVLSASQSIDMVVDAFQTCAQWHHCSPSTVATLLSVIVSKLSSAHAAVECVRRCSQLSGSLAAEEQTGASVVALATQHPSVRMAILRKCCEDKNGWKEAAEVLVTLGASSHPTPTDLLSTTVLRLRQKREVSLLIRVLQEHIIPTGGHLSPEALEALFECILAHNRAVHSFEGGNGPLTSHHRAVHWKSALSWATDLQAPQTQDRIVKTGTGASSGAAERHPPTVLSADRLLSPRLVSLLLHICVDSGSPEGGLQVIGYARKVNKTELALSEEICALLYCIVYDRPYEAEAIVLQAAKKRGEDMAAPLRQLLTLARGSKQREAAARVGQAE